jgi:hypothetical protein
MLVTTAAGQTGDLKTVLEKAQRYVSAYQEKLGAVIGEEEYTQRAIWYGATFHFTFPRGGEPATPLQRRHG